MGSVVPIGNVSIGVCVVLGEEGLGFLFKEVLVCVEQDVADEDIEVSAREVVLVMASDG